VVTTSGCALEIGWAHDGERVCAFRIVKDGYPRAEVGGGERTFIDELVARDGVYTYEIVAVNGCGESAPSSSASGTVPIPDPPANCVASDGTCEAVLVTWEDTTEGELGFVIERQGHIAGEVGPNATAFSDSTGEPSILFNYRVWAFDACGAGYASNRDLGHREALPLSAGTLVARSGLCHRVELSWLDRSYGESGFRIVRDGGEIALVGHDVTRYVDESAVPGQSYTYTVVATNSCGDAAPSNAALGEAGFLPPTSANNCAASNDPCEVITVTWTDRSEDETGFRVLRDDVEVATLLPNIDHYIDSTAVLLQVYRYRVVATSPCGDADPSNEALGSRTLPGEFAAPELIAPADLDTCLTPGTLFVWHSVPGALSYTLRAGSDCEAGDFAFGTLPDTALFLAMPPSSSIHWNVTANGPCDGRGVSVCRTFETGPSREAPPAPEILPFGDRNHVLFRWSPVLGALHYTLTIVEGFCDHDWGEPQSFTVAGAETTLTCPDWWVVAARLSARVCGGETDTVCVDQEIIDPPVVLEYFRGTPLDGHVLLEWKSSSETAISAYNVWRATRGASTFERLTGEGIPGGQPSYAFDDAGAAPAQTHRYRLSEHTTDGQEITLAEIEVFVPDARPALTLLPGVPNPFHPRSSFRVWLPQDGETTIDVFDVNGRRVRQLLAAWRAKGWHELHWDGRDEGGDAAASGTYLVRVTAGGREASQRVTLTR
jgi:hypothetical protein